MIARLLLDHPRTVGETYAQHARTAGGFGVAMIAGGLAALVHAVVPAWCERTASNTVKRLYSRMTARQPAFQRHTPAHAEPSWQLEYEI